MKFTFSDKNQREWNVFKDQAGPQQSVNLKFKKKKDKKKRVAKKEKNLMKMIK